MANFGKYAMSAQELSDFCASAEQAVLGTLRKDGSPFLVPLGFDYDGEYFYVTLGKDRAGVQRMRNDSRVALTVASYPAYPTKFVIIQGIAEEIPDSDHEISRRILLRGPKDKWAQRHVDPEKFFQSWVSVGRVVFRIAVTFIQTFDGTHTSKQDKYGAGTGMPMDEKWQEGVASTS